MVDQETVKSFSLPGLAVIPSRKLPGWFGYVTLFHPDGDRVFVRSGVGTVDAFGFDATTGVLSTSPLFTIPVGTARLLRHDQSESTDGDKLSVRDRGS